MQAISNRAPGVKAISDTTELDRRPSMPKTPRLLQKMDPEVTASLTFLRELRNTADYDMDVSIETVALQFLDAQRRFESVIVRLDALTAPETDS